MQISDIRALLDKITLGDWSEMPTDMCSEVICSTGCTIASLLNDDDAFFIAASPRIVRLLLRALEIAGEEYLRDKSGQKVGLPHMQSNYWISKAELEQLRYLESH